ncbi:MAG: hypothetical protein M1826_006780 [Phylliscum demangeonii]|nr:MAG: hypothetical protein M1826_006780 [Phylliscum demangeonii]
MPPPSSRQPRGYTQDYVARIRYSNALPPPCMPPKLLEIPGRGLPYYLSSEYGMRLAQDQPVNIEANAELGMPLSLVGLPGVFDGDESAIEMPREPRTVDPKDFALLRPLAVLRNEPVAVENVSMFRRTAARTAEKAASQPAKGTTVRPRLSLPKKRRRRADPSIRENAAFILKTVMRGFDLAYPQSSAAAADAAGDGLLEEEREAWKNPQHPTKRHLKLVDSFPILPDLNAVSDSGGYILMTFAKYPVPVSDAYDDRLDCALLRPVELSAAASAARRAGARTRVADPSKPAPSLSAYDYHYFVPQHARSVDRIKQKFAVDDAQRDDPALYDYEDPETGHRCFRYEQARIYETVTTSSQTDRKFDEIALTIYDPARIRASSTAAEEGPSPKKQKAAYYYPIVQKTNVRPRRSNLLMPGLGGMYAGGEDDKKEHVNALDVTVRDLNDEERARRVQHLTEYEPAFAASNSADEGLARREKTPALDELQNEVEDERAASEVREAEAS